MTAVRVVLALGLIAIFAVALYGESAPALPTVSDLPSFDNPFSMADRTYELKPDADLDSDPPATATDEFETEGTGIDDPTCDTGTHPVGDAVNEFWGCVTDHARPQNPEPDGLQTRVNILAGDATFTVSLEAEQGGTGDNYLSGLTVVFQCRGNSATSVRILFAFETSVGIPLPTGSTPEVRCTPGVFDVYEADYGGQLPDPGGTNGLTTSDFSNARLRVELGGTEELAVGDVDISDLFVLVRFSPARACTGGFADRFWCQGEQFFAFVVSFFTLLGEVVSFSVEWGLLIFNFIIAVFLIIAWLYAIPGMPTALQVIVDVVVTALAFALIIEFARLIRG